MSSQNFRPIDLEALYDYSTGLSPKIIYAGNQPSGDQASGIGQPYVVVAQDYIALVAAADKVLSVNPELGLTLSGPMALAASPDQVSFSGGYLKVNPLVNTGIASTSATPVPWLLKTTPRVLEGSDDLSSATSFAEAGLGV